ncbi:DUF2953 domain-containing protein [uncultured Methanobrevibacter sp.]|uniref:DUF2953 domain-containing protein n=1 Tax=uncultured Methanobrevibacter sp. TaxID=253161 RepID=UPI00261D3CB5|nr:DUF2953 domain-containing protein [uncultured Methanobrevibacter sp.]
MGLRISLSFEKTGSNISTIIKIKIFKKITIYISSKEKESEEEDDKKDQKNYGNLIKPLKNALPHIWIFLKKSTKSIKVNKLESHLKFGLASYADTAQYIGYIWTIIGFIKTLYPISKLSAEPIFGDPIIDFKGSGDIDINLLKLIFPVISLISKKEIRTLIKSFRGNDNEQ